MEFSRPIFFWDCSFLSYFFFNFFYRIFPPLIYGIYGIWSFFGTVGMLIKVKKHVVTKLLIEIFCKIIILSATYIKLIFVGTEIFILFEVFCQLPI